jgi:Xaa-Pro aminopeptidase
MNVRYDAINPELFIKNRSNLSNQLKKNSLAIFHSNDEMLRNGDCFFPFRQNSDLFYLSGIDQEQSILLLFPDCPNPSYREILFVLKTSEKIKIWEGSKYSKKQATKISGIKTVFWLENFENIFKLLTNGVENIYVNQNEHDRVKSEVDSRNIRFTRKLKNQLPAHNFERVTPIITSLREIKSSFEIDIVKEACKITEKGLLRVLDFIRPDVWEYEIEAEVTHEFIVNKSNGHAYNPIFASGQNACILHYINNNQQCKNGDLILMDFGAEYANYASDLTRTIPVNGRFSKRQKEVYDSIRSVMVRAIDMMNVGTLLDEFNKEIGKLIESELIQLGLLSRLEIKKQDSDNPLYKKYFPHGTAHFLGMDVHDVGNRYSPFKSGMVLTCEPGIYIPEEGIGIRIENDILISKDGPIDLMSSIPIETEEIEELMNKN